MTLSRIGGLIAPPLGNSLAVYGPRVPFVLWGTAMALLGLAALGLMRRDRTQTKRAVSVRNPGTQYSTPSLRPSLLWVDDTADG